MVQAEPILLASKTWDGGCEQSGAAGGRPHLVEHLRLAVAQLGEDGLVGRALLHGVPDLVEVLRACQLMVAVRVQQPEVGVQLAPVVARQLRADAVQRDVERAPVSLRAIRCVLQLLNRPGTQHSQERRMHVHAYAKAQFRSKRQEQHDVAAP